MRVNVLHLCYSYDMRMGKAYIEKNWRVITVVQETITIRNESGLHLRPAGDMVGIANKYSSRVMLICGEHTMNCKSLMSLLAFPVCPGD